MNRDLRLDLEDFEKKINQLTRKLIDEMESKHEIYNGTIKWYNKEKGFGFIELKHDIFFTKDSLLDNYIPEANDNIKIVGVINDTGIISGYINKGG